MILHRGRTERPGDSTDDPQPHGDGDVLLVFFAILMRSTTGFPTIFRGQVCYRRCYMRCCTPIRCVYMLIIYS